MDDSNSTSGSLAKLIVGVVLLLGLVGWILFDSSDLPDLPPEQPLSIDELVALKNEGIAQLENIPNKTANDGTRSIEVFEKIVAEQPDELFGHQNLAIAGVLAAEKQKGEADERPKKFTATVAKARESIASLRSFDPESGIAEILDAKLAITVGDDEAALLAFDAAIKARPNDYIPKTELFMHVRNSLDAELRGRAIRDAAAAKIESLVMLEYLVREQAESKDPKVSETLENMQVTLAPFAPVLARQEIDLVSEVPRFIKRISDEDVTVWNRVKIRMIQVFNVLRQEFGYQSDLFRLQRHPLEYVIHDFSDSFYKENPTTTITTDQVNVEFISGDDATAIPELPGTSDIAICDFDLDRQSDLVAVSQGKLTVFSHDGSGANWISVASIDISPELTRLRVADFDRDADVSTEENYMASDVDFLVFGPAGYLFIENVFDKETKTRSLAISEKTMPSEKIAITDVAITDIENDGDLDVVILSEGGVAIWQNQENWDFHDNTSLAIANPGHVAGAVTLGITDTDLNLQTDILASGHVLQNIRHGRFSIRKSDNTAQTDVSATSFSSADIDNSGTWDTVISSASGVTVSLTDTQPGEKSWVIATINISGEPALGAFTIDFDNDGYVDIGAFRETGVDIWRNLGNQHFAEEPTITIPAVGLTACKAGDIDNDGDLDLAVVANGNPASFINHGGNENNWIQVRLYAEPDPMFKVQRSNLYGIGSSVEVKAGSNYQSAMVTSQLTHFGIGKTEQADAVRVLWTNGIPQNLIKPDTRVTFTEKQQLLKGSCPYLYTWTGEKFEFLTDLLWAAPIGLQFGEGVIAPTREWEYLLIPGDRLVPIDDEYRMQITEELWEAAYFDQVELIAVDHRIGTSVFSNEKVGPSSISSFKIHSFLDNQLKPSNRVVSSTGENITSVLANSDGVFTKLFQKRHKQGLTDPYFMEIELGDIRQANTVQLVLTGWMFPTDTSINIALSQNKQLSGPLPPSITVPRQINGTVQWEEVIAYMGFPGGKTKTIVVDLPIEKLNREDGRIRINSSMELYWDSIFLAIDADQTEIQQFPVPLIEADLHYRGVSSRLPRTNNGPEGYEYDKVVKEPVWPPMAGDFTRFGDVTELLLENDHHLVVLGAGDEITVRFSQLPDPPSGWKRDFIVHNVGWDKDADLNTITGQRVEPLPYTGMKQYPPGSSDALDSAEYRTYLKKYQTRKMDFEAFWNQLKP